MTMLRFKSKVRTRHQKSLCKLERTYQAGLEQMNTLTYGHLFSVHGWTFKPIFRIPFFLRVITGVAVGCVKPTFLRG